LTGYNPEGEEDSKMNPQFAKPATTGSLEKAPLGDTRLYGIRLGLARAACVVAGVLSLSVFVASIPVTYEAVLVLFCSGSSCAHRTQTSLSFAQQLMAFGIPIQAYVIYYILLNIIFVSIYYIVAIILFWRRSDDWMALFASFFLLTFAINFASNMMVPTLHWVFEFVNFLGAISLVVFFYLFPSGKFVPRWTILLSIAAILYWGLKYFFPFLQFTPSNNLIFSTLLFVVIVGGMIVAQVYRYLRVSNDLQRQQTKWVVFGVSIGIGGYIVFAVLVAIFFSSVVRSPIAIILYYTFSYFLLLLVPISIAFAILRSRLWDIDIIINRTLVYGILTMSVILLYVLVVGGLSTLLQVRGSLIISLLATGLIAVLFQPLRSRLQSAVNRMMYGERDDPYRILSRLGEHLEATLVPDAILPEIVETVAQALRLPYVAIEVQEGDQLRMAASYGTPVDASLRIPLHYQQDTIGQLLLASRSPGESFSSVDRRLLDDLARQVGTAAHAVRLSADLQRSRERLVLAQEEERRRLARELHDSVSQALYGISLGAHTARMQLDRDPKQVAESLDYVLELSEAALIEMRALIFELRPESLETEGLVTALTKQAAAMQARQNIVVQADLGAEPDLPLEVKQDLYRIVQEALHNTVKHARASQVKLRLNQANGAVTVEVCDNGKGFDTSTSFPGHLGLHSMQERVKSLGGELKIESAPGEGTCIRAQVPVHTIANNTGSLTT
jgi:signal transduction histidine kinase